MPAENKTTTEKPRPPRTIKPATKPATSEGNRSGSTGNPSSNKGRPPRPKNHFWKNLWENIGWGLVIGLPIILVILAILWRSTNGFQGNPTVAPVPTPVPSPTAGVYFSPPATSGTKNRILYLQSPDGFSPLQVFSANSDGSNPAQLTNSRELKGGLVWSPDGRQAAFTADGVGVQVVNYDGSGLHTLAYGGFNPVWSPDGKQVAFLKNSPASDGQGPDRTGQVRVLYVAKADGQANQERQLASEVLGHNWSPDSKQIAFFSLRNAVMFTVEVESAKTEQIKLPEKIGGWYPTFAPDGNSFVFYGNPNPTAMVAGLDLAVAAGNIATVETGLPSPTPAPTSTSNPAATGSPTPVGTPTATVIPGPPSQISLYQVNRDGTNLKKLQELEPAGGGKFRFSYYVATSADIVSVLTSRPYYKVGPVFGPDGKSVAALYSSKDDKIGLALVRTDGGPVTTIVEGENGLEAGVRLNPAFIQDKLYYSFVAPRAATPVSATPAPAPAQPLRQSRYFDAAAKAEKKFFDKGDTLYLSCCGFVSNK